MDLDELNSTQIVLLTLLVSFVTSIATGIVTVTLMDQAPPGVTKTINRVVERTVERVVPVESDKPNVITTVQEKTIVVKEDDLITDSIERNKNKIIRLYNKSTFSPIDPEDEEAVSVETVVESSFIGIGIFVSSSGIVVTDKDTAFGEDIIKVLTERGEVFDSTIVNNDALFETTLLRVSLPEGSEKSFSKVEFMGEKSLKLGQTVMALGGKDRTNVSMGIISDIVHKDIDIVDEETEETTTKSILSSISTNINTSSLAGSPLINIFGEMIGIKTLPTSNTSGSFYPIYKIQEQMALLSEAENESEDEVSVEIEGVTTDTES